MLYNSLKDVTWSTTTLPLDRLVSAYRLPQLVKLDSGKICLELCGLKRSVYSKSGAVVFVLQQLLLRVGGCAPVEFQ